MSNQAYLQGVAEALSHMNVDAQVKIASYNELEKLAQLDNLGRPSSRDGAMMMDILNRDSAGRGFGPYLGGGGGGGALVPSGGGGGGGGALVPSGGGGGGGGGRLLGGPAAAPLLLAEEAASKPAVQKLIEHEAQAASKVPLHKTMKGKLGIGAGLAALTGLGLYGKSRMDAAEEEERAQQEQAALAAALMAEEEADAERKRNIALALGGTAAAAGLGYGAYRAFS